MGAPSGINFANNYSSATPATQGMPADQPHVRGGKYALVISATSFPSTCKLQYLARGGVAIDITANITTNGVYVYDLPAGQYQLFMSGGTATALNADLVTMPQD